MKPVLKEIGEIELQIDGLRKKLRELRAQEMDSYIDLIKSQNEAIHFVNLASDYGRTPDDMKYIMTLCLPDHTFRLWFSPTEVFEIYYALKKFNILPVMEVKNGYKQNR